VCVFIFVCLFTCLFEIVLVFLMLGFLDVIFLMFLDVCYLDIVLDVFCTQFFVLTIHGGVKKDTQC
jgi:hypothetical protein